MMKPPFLQPVMLSPEEDLTPASEAKKAGFGFLVIITLSNINKKKKTLLKKIDEVFILALTSLLKRI